MEEKIVEAIKATMSPNQKEYDKYEDFLLNQNYNNREYMAGLMQLIVGGGLS